MKTLYIDIETYSSVDLPASGPYAYAEDPDFQILMAAYAYDDEPVRVAVGDDEIEAAIGNALTDPDVRKVAHNAQFERVCFSRWLPRRHGGTCEGSRRHGWHQSRRTGLWVCANCEMPTRRVAEMFLPSEQWEDTAALAVVYGYPRSLEALAKALGAEEKDAAGTRLISLFCKPDRSGKRVMPEDKLDEWMDFIAYCAQDVETLRDIHHRLPDGWPTPLERSVFLADQDINDRGMRIDVEMAHLAKEAAEENKVEQKGRLSELTGADNPGSVQQLRAGLAGIGLDLPNLKAETVAEVLERDDLTDEQREALELRQELSLSAASKYGAALAAVSRDGRIRGAFRYHGAHTGRWTGQRVQPQNLPRATLGPKDDVELQVALTEAAILDLQLGLGGSAYTLKALVRSLFVGPFTVVDYSAIEARVIAWLAGEHWALDAFAAGRDIYVETADRMSTPSHQLDRGQGKVAVLALGYAGGIGSLRAMGADGNDEELQRLVDQWRYANRNIVDLWAQLDWAFSESGPVGAGHLVVEIHGRDRALRLPSGRAIWYRNCKWEKFRDSKGRVKSAWRFDGPRGRADTYGGRLAENATQAVARDLLAHGLVRLEAEGFRTVGHVHDEVIVEGADVDQVNKLISTPPDWAAGLPMAGEGFTCERYRKG